MVIQRFRPSFSGHGVQVEALCAALAQMGTAPTIYTANPGDAPEDEKCGGYRIRRLRKGRSRATRWPAFGARVFSALRRDRPDVVHVHALTDGLYGSWLYRRLTGTPLIFEMTLLGTDEPGAIHRDTARFPGLRNRMYRSCDAYVAMSRAFLPAYEASGLEPERLHVIPQGVDTDRFAAAATDRQTGRAQLGLPRDAPVIGFVGSLIERKGIDILLTAWPRVLAEHPDARLLLIGPRTPTEPRAAAAWSSLSEEARKSVVMTGERDDVEHLLPVCDAFAFPTRREGFGAVIIEAMAAGVPCVVAELPGITDYIFSAPGKGLADAGDGIVVPQDDPMSLADALNGLLANRQAAASVAARALERARAEFEMTSVAARYVDLYRQLTGAAA